MNGCSGVKSKTVEKKRKTYYVRSGWMVFSNGKLKSNTLIADWWKNEVV